MTLKLPHTLGPYQLSERIAVGGMAEIFLAQEIRGGEFGTELVVKRMHEHLSRTPSSRARFDNEAKLLEQIQHPAFVQLFDSGVDDDIPYLVFAHVDGQSLHEGPERQPGQAIAICADLCDALHHLHTTVHVAHCDISPQNVMITRNGELKVTDLGIAQPLGSASIDDSLHANLPYMSPEQARQQKLSAQSDLFSTGVILWEMLTGKSLFAGQNDFETINNILSLKVENPCDIRRELAPEIGQLTLNLLARDTHQRPRDCAEAARQLRALSQTVIPLPHPTESSKPGLVMGIVLVVALLAGYFFFRS